MVWILLFAFTLTELQDKHSGFSVDRSELVRHGVDHDLGIPGRLDEVWKSQQRTTRWRRTREVGVSKLAMVMIECRPFFEEMRIAVLALGPFRGTKCMIWFSETTDKTQARRDFTLDNAGLEQVHLTY
jgi:hypothetical protein